MQTCWVISTAVFFFFFKKKNNKLKHNKWKSEIVINFTIRVYNIVKNSLNLQLKILRSEITRHFFSYICNIIFCKIYLKDRFGFAVAVFVASEKCPHIMQTPNFTLLSYQ